MEWLQEHVEAELYQQLAAQLKGNDRVKLANLAGGEYVSKYKYLNAKTNFDRLLRQAEQQKKQAQKLKIAICFHEILQEELVRLQASGQRVAELYRRNLQEIAQLLESDKRNERNEYSQRNNEKGGFHDSHYL